MSRGRDLDERDALTDDRVSSIPSSLQRRSRPARSLKQSVERDGRRRPSDRPRRRDGGLGVSLGNRRGRVGSSSQTYRLRRSEFEALEDIGRFRTVMVRDLQQFRYGGDASKLREDMRSLSEQRLVQQRYVTLGRGGERAPVVTLTDRGKSLLDSESSLGNDVPQEFHAGFVKPSEIEHDAALYRVYQAEAGEIERQGGVVERVVLDYELKGSINRDVNAAGDLPPEDLDQLREQVAAAHRLSVVDRKIPLPDFRIEYQSANGDAARVDLELTTEHYKKSQIATKANAGFKTYSLAPGGSRAGSPVREEREITAGILSV